MADKKKDDDKAQAARPRAETKEEALAAPLGTEADLGLSSGPSTNPTGDAYSRPMGADPVKTAQDQAGLHVGEVPQGEMTDEKVEAYEAQKATWELQDAVDEKS